MDYVPTHHYGDANRKIGAFLMHVPPLKGRANGTGGSTRWRFPLECYIKKGYDYVVQLTDDEATVEDTYTTERDEWVAAVSRTDGVFRDLGGSLKNHRWLTEVQRREIGNWSQPKCGVDEGFIYPPHPLIYILYLSRMNI